MPLTYCLAPLVKSIDKASLDALGESKLDEARELLVQAADLGEKRAQDRHYPEPSRLQVEAGKALELLERKRRNRK